MISLESSNAEHVVTETIIRDAEVNVILSGFDLITIKTALGMCSDEMILSDFTKRHPDCDPRYLEVYSIQLDSYELFKHIKDVMQRITLAGKSVSSKTGG